ncbi:MAG: hypothetical protein HY898_11115 [Deltaproteobacteria bacterium]|nr:hypothetical protein [Deltaproteobacteria bacterium]
MKPFILSLFIASGALALSGCMSTGMGQSDETSPNDVVTAQAPDNQASSPSPKPARARTERSSLDRHPMLR